MTFEIPEEILHETLEQMREAYENGDNNQLIKAIRWCGNNKLIMPEWVTQAFFNATNEWYSMKVKTLDEAFGLTWPKGKSFNSVKRQRDLKFEVFNRVNSLHLAGEPIDQALFDKVAEDMPISGSLVSKYYYKAKRQLSG